MKEYVPGSSPLLDAIEAPVQCDMALTEAASLTSIAVSLKRIAGALEYIANECGPSAYEIARRAMR